MKDIQIAIIGAGIGGMTAAVTLAQKGLIVNVFEQAPELSEVGAGLTVTPNATKGLIYLGLGEAMNKIGMAHDLQGVRHYQTKEIIVPLKRGKHMLEKYGAYQFQVHRADIHDLLIENLEQHSPGCVSVDHQLVGIDQKSDRVKLIFNNQAEYECDFVIGADGTRSAVRTAILGNDEPEFSGYVAWRGVVPTDGLDESDFDECGSSAFISPGRVFARYLIRDAKEYNYVAFLATDEWAEEGWSIPSKVETVLETFSDYNQQVKNIISATPPEGCYKWGIFTRQPIGKWSSERVTLLGDAAHPLEPFMGQGASMAIEDGVVLGRIVEDSSSFSEIIERYEAARIERSHFVTEHSKKAGQRFTGNNPDAYTKEDHKNEEELGLFYYDPGNVIV
ncbi:MAG: FAD-dependent monooxygenase [Gammaproteobacteria bacterium]|nr:FAD-dependent monooxygenase [Gammaproteobacteria bacterium]